MQKLDIVYEIASLVQFLISLLKFHNIPISVTAGIGQVISQHLLCENCILDFKQNIKMQRELKVNKRPESCGADGPLAEALLMGWDQWHIYCMAS